MASHQGIAIEIDQLTKVYETAGGGQFRALSEVSVTVKPGEFVSVVGPSGCGKSTLMLMVAGLLSSSSGRVRVGGKSLDKPLTDVGIVFQDPLLLEFRTALSNVLLQGKVRGLPAGEIRARADELFERLNISHAADRYPKQLSGGMRQRVALARALVHRPSVLLMDEPFGALDALTRLQVRHDLERLLMTDAPTVLFITHSVEEAVALSDRVLVMSPTPGQVVEELIIDLPRPRPLSLAEAPEFGHFIECIYGHFERMGVIHKESKVAVS